MWEKARTSVASHINVFFYFSVLFLFLADQVINVPILDPVPSDQYLVSASSSGDKLVVSSLKSAPVPVVELADGVSPLSGCFIFELNLKPEEKSPSLPVGGARAVNQRPNVFLGKKMFKVQRKF